MATDALTRVWSSPPGFVGWLSAVNHKNIGLRYMVTSLVFFLTGGIEALIMRAQLTTSTADLISPETYNQLFTMHGSTMMFLFVVPFLEGLSIYVVPLMIGTRDMAFPRLNAFGYWVFLFSGILLHASLLAGVAPDSGWFNYPPLTGPGFSPGLNIDFWVTLITFIEVAALAAAVELIVTILKQRAPGMTLARMPIFVWASLVMAFMIVFAMPTLVAASLMLGLDRFVGTHFFNVAVGGQPLLWQHLFWFFGHPDVYIMLVPALGVVSTIVPVAARRPLAGHLFVVTSLVAIGFLSFGLWVHHMYAAGLPLLGMNLFASAGMVILLPNAVQIFAWIATLWGSRPKLTTPLLFCLGFLVLLIMGGITGLMVSSVPFDWQAHDTYFVVAHFHYVLIGGVVFPIFAAIHFWFPKAFGRMLYESIGKATFWLFFVGFNLTFFPMHILGFQGMPRRVYTYLPGLGWEPLNLLATVGAALIAFSVLTFLVNVWLSYRHGERAGEDPWGAPNLEWSTSSPPPVYNYPELRVVTSRYPLWDGLSEDVPIERRKDDPQLSRLVLITSVVGATPHHLLELPPPSLTPLYLALSLTVAFAGVMLHPWFVVAGGVLAAISLVAWHWPRQRRWA